MNCSIYSADRTTHLKIVVVALVASIGVTGFGILSRISAGDRYSQTARVVKAGTPSFQAEDLPSRCLPARSLCST
jgi:hypothetical protein